jgi:hypothetical protein
VPLISDRTRRLEGGGSRAEAPSPLRWAMGLSALAVVAAGCTDPQGGIYAHSWCRPTAADNQAYVMLDDMEDGDSLACAGGGSWTVDGTGDLAPQKVGGPATPTDLPAADQALRAPSFRAQYLHGTLVPGGYARIILPLPATLADLRPFQEIDFWARGDGVADTVRVGLFTASAIDGDFGDDVVIQPTWGDDGKNNNVAIAAFTRSDGVTHVTADDLSASTAIQFLFSSDKNGGATSFGFWIDDVELKRLPVP